jgi:hypothetical protein
MLSARKREARGLLVEREAHDCSAHVGNADWDPNIKLANQGQNGRSRGRLRAVERGDVLLLTLATQLNRWLEETEIGVQVRKEQYPDPIP